MGKKQTVAWMDQELLMCCTGHRQIILGVEVTKYGIQGYAEWKIHNDRPKRWTNEYVREGNDQQSPRRPSL